MVRFVRIDSLMNTSSMIPISAIKVRIPPRRRELITRPRLVDLLYEQLDKPLLFVIAPAGYGKTSLLVDLAAQVDLPFCWLSLDTLDQDPQRFLRYLIAAIAERFPAFGRDSLAVLESMTSLASEQDQLLITMTNEISTRIHDHFILVLDDFHFVENVPVIGQLIGRLLELAGETLHLVISSRNLPDFPAAPLLIARNQVGGITFKDLSFQTGEIQQLFQQNRGIELSQPDAEAMLRETEGWIAAIHLSHDLPGSKPLVHPLLSAAALFDFFSREVMERQPQEMQRFMLLTSMFEAFDITMCERVLAPLVGEHPLDWAGLFRRAQTASLFSVPLDDDGHWMRYHHLFQHFLRSQLQYEEPALAWNIQQNLAHVYEQQQHWEEALQIYDRLNDHQNQIRLLGEVGFNFIESGRILTLDSWLKKIPVELVYAQPLLASLLGTVYATQGDPRQALALLDQAEAGLRKQGRQADWVTALVRRSEVYRQLGQYDSTLKDIEAILETVQDSAQRNFQIVHAEAMRIRGLALFGQGRVGDALPWLEDSLHRYRLLGLGNHLPILETELGVIHRRLGELQVSARYFASALHALEHAGNNGWKSRLLNNMGMLKYTTGELQEAHSLLQAAAQTAKQCGYVRIQTNALISLGDLLSDLGELDSAYHCYDQALTQATHLGHSLYIFYASLGEARLKRMSGNPLLALDELRQVELSQVSLGSYEQAFFNLEKGHSLLELNHLDEASRCYHEALALFEAGGNQMEKKLARLWHEVTALLLAPQADVQGLRELLPAQREWRTPTPLMIHAGRAVRWLKSRGHQRLLREPALRLFFEHAGRVLDSLPKVAEALHPPSSDHVPASPRLEITTFGPVQVRQDGRIVELSDWQTREARDLFFYFLQSPPRSKEQIGMDFWPDLSTSRLKMRFKINIYRIRQALGQDVILFKDEQYTFNRSITHHWDRERFDELFQAARRRNTIQERIVVLEQAAALVRGPYLADLEAHWAEPDRLRYEDRHRLAMLELAELYLKSGRTQECLDLARSLLTLDPLLEAAHRLILQVCAARHDPAGLALQYRHYQQIMQAELGMLPSLEMRSLYEKLLTSI